METMLGELTIKSREFLAAHVLIEHWLQRPTASEVAELGILGTYGPYRLKWTGWKMDYVSDMLFSQLVAYGPNRYYYAASPGSEGIFIRGQSFDVCPRQGRPILTLDDMGNWPAAELVLIDLCNRIDDLLSPKGAEKNEPEPKDN